VDIGEGAGGGEVIGGGGGGEGDEAGAISRVEGEREKDRG
jgi:hypothetical protein